MQRELPASIDTSYRMPIEKNCRGISISLTKNRRCR